MGVVPTLIHDGKILNESNFIMEYLDEVFPNPPLTPSDPFERAQMRIWMNKCENRMHKNIIIVSFIKQGCSKRYCRIRGWVCTFCLPFFPALTVTMWTPRFAFGSVFNGGFPEMRIIT